MPRAKPMPTRCPPQRPAAWRRSRRRPPKRWPARRARTSPLTTQGPAQPTSTSPKSGATTRCAVSAVRYVALAIIVYSDNFEQGTAITIIASCLILTAPLRAAPAAATSAGLHCRQSRIASIDPVPKRSLKGPGLWLERHPQTRTHACTHTQARVHTHMHTHTDTHTHSLALTSSLAPAPRLSSTSPRPPSCRPPSSRPSMWTSSTLAGGCLGYLLYFHSPSTVKPAAIPSLPSPLSPLAAPLP